MDEADRTIARALTRHSLSVVSATMTITESPEENRNEQAAAMWSVLSSIIDDDQTAVDLGVEKSEVPLRLMVGVGGVTVMVALLVLQGREDELDELFQQCYEKLSFNPHAQEVRAPSIAVLHSIMSGEPMSFDYFEKLDHDGALFRVVCQSQFAELVVGRIASMVSKEPRELLSSIALAAARD